MRVRVGVLLGKRVWVMVGVKVGGRAVAVKVEVEGGVGVGDRTAASKRQARAVIRTKSTLRVRRITVL